MFEVGHSSLHNGNLVCFPNKNMNKIKVLSWAIIRMKIFIFLLFYFEEINASCTEGKIRIALPIGSKCVGDDFGMPVTTHVT